MFISKIIKNIYRKRKKGKCILFYKKNYTTIRVAKPNLVWEINYQRYCI